ADATPPSGPAGAGPVHPAAAPPTAAPAGAAAAGTETAALLERQLQLMAQQLALAAKLDGLDAETLRGLLASQHALMADQLALASGRAAAAGATTVQRMAADEPRAPDTPAPAAAARDGVPAARAVMDPTRPVVPCARLGRAPDGAPGWYVPDPERAGGWLRVAG